MDLPNRKSIRLKGFDYSSSGAYFVTICTNNREEMFGSVGVDPCVDPDKYIRLNDIGKMVNVWWFKIPDKFPDIDLGTFQIMPNHIHGIIFINGRTHGSAPTLGTIIQWFKTMTTNEYMNNVKNLHWAQFNKRMWQRNFYEHIIRNEKELFKIKEYIQLNPDMWERDRNNSENLYI